MTYQRVLLKLSGEALMGDLGYGIDPKVVADIAEDIAEVVKLNIQVAIVVGGGNIFRGVKASADGMDRATADYVGMIATVMNAMTLQDALERINVPTRVQTAIAMQEVAEPYIRRKAIRHLELGRVVIFGAGSGNPFFTTDTTAALRAAEIDAQVIFKATKVDGVYDCDPMKNPNARRYETLNYNHVLTQYSGSSLHHATLEEYYQQAFIVLHSLQDHTDLLPLFFFNFLPDNHLMYEKNHRAI